MDRCVRVLLLVVRYRDDSERKRLEYLIDKYQARIRVEKPSGTTLLVDGNEEDLTSLLEELYAKLGPEILEVYEVREPSLLPEPRKTRLILHTSQSCTEALGGIGFLMARLKGVLRHEIGGTREYTVKLRSGKLNVRVSKYSLGGGPCRLLLEIEGYGGIVDRFARILERELSLLGEVERQ